MHFAYGGLTLFARPFHASSAIHASIYKRPSTPRFPMVWALPCSLAATWGIDVSFFSSGYLDVSVPRVAFSMPILFSIGYLRIAAGELPHSEICGYNGCLRLTAAFRSLPRPSSAPSAKASALCPFSLDLFFAAQRLAAFWFSSLKLYYPTSSLFRMIISISSRFLLSYSIFKVHEKKSPNRDSWWRIRGSNP